MANILAFPARTGQYRNPPTYWRTYKVYAVDPNGDERVALFRALSADSAHCRARQAGYVHVKRIEKVSDT